MPCGDKHESAAGAHGQDVRHERFSLILCGLQRREVLGAGWLLGDIGEPCRKGHRGTEGPAVPGEGTQGRLYCTQTGWLHAHSGMAGARRPAVVLIESRCPSYSRQICSRERLNKNTRIRGVPRARFHGEPGRGRSGPCPRTNGRWPSPGPGPAPLHPPATWPPAGAPHEAMNLPESVSPPCHRAPRRAAPTSDQVLGPGVGAGG